MKNLSGHKIIKCKVMDHTIGQNHMVEPNTGVFFSVKVTKVVKSVDYKLWYDISGIDKNYHVYRFLYRMPIEVFSCWVVLRLNCEDKPLFPFSCWYERVKDLNTGKWIFDMHQIENNYHIKLVKDDE